VKTYVATTGIDWVEAGEPRRIESGEEVPALLAKSAPWLITQGHVAEIEEETDGPRSR
jgi:hypothetical protein